MPSIAFFFRNRKRLERVNFLYHVVFVVMSDSLKLCPPGETIAIFTVYRRSRGEKKRLTKPQLPNFPSSDEHYGCVFYLPTTHPATRRYGHSGIFGCPDDRISIIVPHRAQMPKILTSTNISALSLVNCKSIDT